MSVLRSCFVQVGDKVCLKGHFVNHQLAEVFRCTPDDNLYTVLEIRATCSRSCSGGCPEHGCEGYVVLKQVSTGFVFAPTCFGYGQDGFALRIVDSNESKTRKKFHIGSWVINHRKRTEDKFDAKFTGLL